MYGISSKDAFRREVMKWQNTITDAQNHLESSEKINCNFFSVEPDLESQTPYDSTSEIMVIINRLSASITTLENDVQTLNEKITDFENRCELLNNIMLDKISAIDTVQDYVRDVANQLSKFSKEREVKASNETLEREIEFPESLKIENIENVLTYQPHVMINKEDISHPNNKTTINEKELIMHIEIDVNKLLVDGKIDTSQLSVNIFGDDKINNYKIEGNIEMMYRITRDPSFIGIINGYVTKIETYVICCMQLSPRPTLEDERLIVDWVYLF